MTVFSWVRCQNKLILRKKPLIHFAYAMHSYQLLLALSFIPEKVKKILATLDFDSLMSPDSEAPKS